ncbi:MAG: methylated-DNA--[protein]-cysteine S-methyltransferase [Burkholderiales bacterium]|nr:MAG: methylated-DNA--[protein]-cysteine S-methyltransferase [Burkholderiales bacterium]
MKKNPDVPPVQARAEIATPLGPMIAWASARGLAGLWFDSEPAAMQYDDVPVQPDHPHIAAARAWLDAYWAGRDTAGIDVALDLQGTLFQRWVWRELLRIPLGRTVTYGYVAEQVGGGAVPRATGHAIGRNPVGVIVPCHRVIGSNGSLTGYAGGIERKRALLLHEGVLLA